ncbi:hypothetical protein XFF6970_440142 [Xanthomonas citri pv. fuscans]|nr:hypothetical protein XFF6970_440142 [Xanthomonas citri pv. fuscans]
MPAVVTSALIGGICTLSDSQHF